MRTANQTLRGGIVFGAPTDFRSGVTSERLERFVVRGFPTSNYAF